MKLAFVLAKYYQVSGSLNRGSQWRSSSVTKLILSFDIIESFRSEFTANL